MGEKAMKFGTLADLEILNDLLKETSGLLAGLPAHLASATYYSEARKKQNAALRTAMKAMKKKIVSKMAKGRFSKSLVLRGTKAKTAGGLSAKDLIRNKAGKIVSKKASAASKKNFAKGLGDWNKAVKKARTILALKGFVAIKKGSPLYTKAKEIYNH
jgi:hypothetical protein